MLNPKTVLTAAAGVYVACILLANYVTTEFGMIPVSPWHMATAGTYFAGVTFVLRDVIQDAVRSLIPPRRDGAETRSDWLAALPVLGLIVIGAGLSFAISDPFIALASAAAFLCAETFDLLIYTPLRRSGWIRAALASNVVGALVDTVLFLWIAGFPIVEALTGQMVGKLAVTGVSIALVLAYRARRQAVIA